MNINLFTIDSTLAATKGASPVLPKSDEIRKGTKFSLTPDDEHPQVNSLEKPTTDNINVEVQNRKEPISKSPEEFTQSIRKRTKSENPCDAENKTKSENPSEAEDKTKPKEQDAASGTIKLPSELQNLIKSWLAEHSVAVEQSKEGAATKIEPKAGQQLAQIIANTQTGKSPPVTGHAVKSAEIKLLHSTEKGQLGLKTVLPTTSEGQNGLKAVLPETLNNTDKVSISPKTIAETKTTASETLSKLLNPNGKEATHTGNNLSEHQNAQKLNIAAVQVSTGQTKDQGTSTSNKNNSQAFEQMLSHNTPQTLITEQTPAAAKNATAANMPGQNSTSNVSADIGKQILESIHSSISQQGAERQITIRLNPPELGKVSITFRQQDGELTGLMEVSKAQTRFEIEQTLPQIIRNLADSGIQIKRLEVMLSNEQPSGQGALGNQSLQSGGSHQQYSGNSGTPGNDIDIYESNEWLAGNNSYENLYELQEALITDSSINMLI